MATEPISGQVFILTAAKASVQPDHLSELIELVQETLAPRLDSYQQRFECIHESETRQIFLVDADHWEELGTQLQFEPRELSAVKRAHTEQLLRIGRRRDREPEFETALEIRDPVVIGI